MRRRLLSFSLLWWLGWLAGCAGPRAPAPADAVHSTQALPTASTQSTTQVIAAFLRTGVPRDAIAIDVRDAAGGEALFAVNHERAMQPASVMKLLPTQAALELLGPAHRWITRVHANGTIIDDVLNGDLVIEGGGDPQFSHHDFLGLLARLRALGLRELRGNLLVDRTLFAPLTHDAAAFDGRPERAYNAPSDALLLNSLALKLRMMPRAPDQPVAFVSEPPLSGFNIDAPLASDAPCTSPYAQLQPVLGVNRLQFHGRYPVDCGERELAFHVYALDPVQYAGAVFRTLWAQLGGHFSGGILAGSVAPGSRELASWTSESLSLQIRAINKESNNPMARNLLLSVVARRGGPPASTGAAIARILDWLAEAGVDGSGIVLQNGSGLSREEKMSASALGLLLQRAWQQPTMPEFVASLPVAGVDGTMARRLVGTPVQGRAHMKTGSLADVAAIAGYVTARSGRRMAVVSIINHPQANAARGAFDELLTWVWENY